ncbi:acyltransferase family protein [Allobranchiibius sp. GilTou73]|uniref:acyltransferase family protein n=1 Tax=Allobranchiibius sp. GilTou73 TaxID=2904523 RepID=UPI001F1B9054|nr:acyltransferase family protein [Allobranchiibius sp. GilTou73]UIJ33821.1 acyltransferase [Allobranchiibius sp. GilTou73]
MARYAAIDGYRGFFVVLVLLYHVGVTQLAGGWIGINHFFVFSGFLIARMLIKEHSKTGRIDPIRFYRRRIRRIVPAMLVLVIAVLVHSWIFETAAKRKEYGGDSFATLGFFLNWRLVTRSDAYFELFGHPSPLRHAWTLSVEEQFYLVAPLLLLLICMATRSRRIRAGVAFGLACVSALWTAHLGYHGITDQARLYYGTDTRAQALLVGVAMGFLLGADERGREPRPLGRTLTHVLAWVGFLTSLSAVFILTPTSAWVYNDGGMLLFAVAAGLMGFASIDRRHLLINRLFAWAPLVYLGRISYSLYLYSWPIHLWLRLPFLPGPVAAGVQLLVAVGAASLSFHVLELPLMMHGIRGIWRRPSLRRLVPTGAVVLTTIGALVLWQGTSAAVGRGVTLVPGSPTYVAGAPKVHFGLLGDSTGSALAAGWDGSAYKDLTLSDQTLIGCDLIDAPTVHAGQVGAAEPQCAPWRRTWPTQMRQAGDTSAVLLAGLQFLTAHRVDGRDVNPRTPAGAALIEQTLTDIATNARASGVGGLQVINLPCHRVDEQELDPQLRFFAAQANDDATVDWANGVIAGWVSTHPDSRLIDLHGVLCAGGYHPSLNDVGLYHDTLHFSPDGAAMVWTWLAPQIRRNALAR